MTSTADYAHVLAVNSTRSCLSRAQQSRAQPTQAQPSSAHPIRAQEPPAHQAPAQPSRARQSPAQHTGPLAFLAWYGMVLNAQHGRAEHTQSYSSAELHHHHDESAGLLCSSWGAPWWWGWAPGCEWASSCTHHLSQLSCPQGSPPGRARHSLSQSLQAISHNQPAPD